MPRYLCMLVVLLVSSSALRAQGCSDAGFCTMGAMKPNQPFNKKIEFKLRSLELSFYRASTTLTPIVYVATADMSFSINAKTSLQVKLPYQAVTGTLAKTQGLGDISLCLTRKLISKEKYDVSLSVGAKIPTNNSDKDINNYPLPMYYQTSLGTYDFITGISWISRNWLFATGIQHPFNKNKNQFLWSAWEGGPEDMGYIAKYPKARELKRGTDIMFRVERSFRFSRLNFGIGLLPIIRINHDELADKAGNRYKEKGTTGMALSGLFTAGYNLDVRSGIKVLIGRKITQRDVNPDGLTRHLVTTISYNYRF